MGGIRIVTFNMKRSYLSVGRHSWERRAGLAAKVILEADPDIIGTQELTEVGISDMVRLLPAYSWAGEGRQKGGHGEFAAVFYKTARFELLETRTFWLSKTPERPSLGWLALMPRICTCCRFRDRQSGEELYFYNTHLDHISYYARINGLRVITRDMTSQRAQSGLPMILTGDLNATPASLTYRRWERETLGRDGGILCRSSFNAMLKPYGRSYHGFSGKKPGMPIDYIFTSKELLITDADIRRDRVDGEYPSDHYPVVADLLIAGETAEYSPAVAANADSARR